MTETDPHERRDRRDPGGGGALPRSARAAQVAAAAAAMRAADPRLLVTVARGSSDHAATYLKYAAELVGGRPGRLGRAVGRLDLRAAAAARRRGLPRHLAVGPEPGHRRDDAERRGGRRADHRDHQRRRLADGGGLRPRAAAAGRARRRASRRPRPSSPRCWRRWRWWRSGARTTALRAAVAALPGQFEQALACDWTPLADRLVRANSAFVLGRGPGFAIANEVALKFKETCAIHAESLQRGRGAARAGGAGAGAFPGAGARRRRRGAAAGDRHGRAAGGAGGGRLPDRGGRRRRRRRRCPRSRACIR